MLVELLKPAGILARNDPKVRTLEGLEQSGGRAARGGASRASTCAKGQSYDVDLCHGQKTGLFLDQRENREAAARYARGRLLDCFSYNGGFALRLARAARRSRRSTFPRTPSRGSRRTRRATALPHVQAREVNVFDELRRLERRGERFDTIVLDPPAFAKNKAAVAEGAGRLQGNQPARAAAAPARAATS